MYCHPCELSTNQLLNPEEMSPEVQNRGISGKNDLCKVKMTVLHIVQVPTGKMQGRI